MPITLEISLPYEGDVSVNRYHGRTPSGRDFTRKTAEKWGMVLRGSINYLLDTRYSPDWIDESKPFRLNVHVRFPRKFSRTSGDAPNFDKYIRDVVASTLGVDDAGTDGEQTGDYGNGELACIRVTIILNTVEPTAIYRKLLLWPPV